MQLEQLDVQGKRVLVRVDFNVPVKDGKVSDATRIEAALPTLNYLRERGARLVLISHFGRPKPNEDGSPNRAKYGLGQIVSKVSECLACPVAFVEDCIGEVAERAAEALRPGEVLLLDNSRFYVQEEQGEREFARALARLADVYVNDAFGAAHRRHASTVVVAEFFDAAHKAFGFLMRKEVDNAQRLLQAPERPFVAVVGGAKVSDKILLLERLLDMVDAVIVGGGMAYTFMAARGGSIGKSLLEADRMDTASNLLEAAARKGVRFLLPSDSVVADAFANDANRQTLPSDAIPADYMGLDIGQDAVAEFSALIRTAKTIFWNGPMGVFEMENFAAGTRSIAQAIAEATAVGAFSVVGGGDSVAALHQLGKAQAVSFVSTGGGAMLELLENGTLPGIQAIL